MNAKKLMAAAFCVTLTVALCGCPLAGPLVVGPYKFFVDVNCDQSTDQLGALFLYGNGTCEVINQDEIFTGTWMVDGGTFSMVIFDYAGDTDAQFTATLDDTGLSSGSYHLENDGMNSCWRATPVAF